MKAELENSLGVETELVKGYGGVFDVRVDGDLVFSKADFSRFPKEGEITSIISKRP